MLEKYKDVLTVGELCEILHIGRNTAYKLLRSQQIPNKHINSKKYIITKNGVKKYLEDCIK